MPHNKDNEWLRTVATGVHLLKAVGVDEIGFSKLEVLKVITACEYSGKAILGGDIWRQDTDGKIISDGSNWYINRFKSESAGEYVRRSCAISRAYVEQLPDADEGRYLYTVTLQ
ncbi:MAG: hypothetical protein EHM48_03495 [Planctomycetaceae bacterium]|nr:MAG: hypothetical protein EHM48_03495 [Planctomycetaceae bacterium]